MSGVEPHCGKVSGWAEGTWRERERERERERALRMLCIYHQSVTTYLELEILLGYFSIESLMYSHGTQEKSYHSQQLDVC